MERIEQTGQSVIDNLRQMFENGDLKAYSVMQCKNCEDTGFEYTKECRPNGTWYTSVIKNDHCCNYWTRRLKNDVGQGRKQL